MVERPARTRARRAGRAAAGEGPSAAGAGLPAVRADRSLTGMARDSIRQAIIDGRLAPGSLHSVKALADQLEVSRTPVREALIDLAGQDMVRFERNRGVRILQTSIHGLEEVMTLRLLLEAPATHRATRQMDRATLAALKRELGAMRRAAGDDDEIVLMEHDRRFHGLILEASGNRRLAEYVDTLRDLILMRGVSTVRRSRSLTEIVAEHRAVLAEIEAGRPERAAAAMKRHIVNTSLLLLAQEGGRDASLGLPWAETVAG
ncbi:MAG: GntR family transcriptional regulator [Solirubrobacterales bacterium]